MKKSGTQKVTPLATLRINVDVSKLSDKQLVKLTRWLNNISAEISAYPESFGKFRANLYVKTKKERKKDGTK